ncbi:NTF2 fold immunity protein [Dickeya fangzhongdai]|uniref:NTF2 fold immunity protein n=1 Tax=Dickeya fangzhongdai TaxID=1778540 RepID=UPI0026DEA30F|nr:NTF2 fold immunity protein [Dickeya fangzhongdai]WKV49483.1 RhsIA family immunity protein [Dickeya fangzhongdai]
MVSAKETLISFMKDMNIWENSYRDAFMSNHGVDKEPYRNELNNIFLKWCTLKERKTGRQISLKVSFPPDYDLENEEIERVDEEKTKAYIYTQKKNGLMNKYRYTLHFKNSEWRIDKKEWLENDKWKQAYL